METFFFSSNSDFQPSNYASDGHSSSIGSSGSALNNETYATVATSGPKRRAGRKKFRETRHPVYKGVRRRNGNKWVCEVREPRKKSRIWLGTFPTAEMAGRAHDVAAMALKGRGACLNFADSAWRLPVLPASATAKDIQKAAAEAAAAFRWSSETESSHEECEMMRKPDQNVGIWVDEEGVFDMDMPALLASMAEGMLLSPPPFAAASGSPSWDDVESIVDMSLWRWSY
ncbi:basic helix-loop-helix protein [Asimina triloba]